VNELADPFQSDVFGWNVLHRKFGVEFSVQCNHQTDELHRVRAKIAFYKGCWRKGLAMLGESLCDDPEYPRLNVLYLMLHKFFVAAPIEFSCPADAVAGREPRARSTAVAGHYRFGRV